MEYKYLAKQLVFPTSLIDLKNVQWDANPKSFEKACETLLKKLEASMQSKSNSFASCWQHQGAGSWSCTTATTCEPVTLDSIRKAVDAFESLKRQHNCQHCDDRAIWSKASRVKFDTQPCDECIECALEHEMLVTVRGKTVKITRQGATQ